MLPKIGVEAAMDMLVWRHVSKHACTRCFAIWRHAVSVSFRRHRALRSAREMRVGRILRGAMSIWGRRAALGRAVDEIEARGGNRFALLKVRFTLVENSGFSAHLGPPCTVHHSRQLLRNSRPFLQKRKNAKTKPDGATCLNVKP